MPHYKLPGGLLCGLLGLAIAASTAVAQLQPPPGAPTPAGLGGQPGPPGQPDSGIDQGPPGNDGMVDLTRGPVHAGFAEMVNSTPAPLPPVPAQPPQPIDELPAAIRPDNPDAQWIPGYWTWDGDYKNFIWISGTWRIPPPGQRWVAGYWTNGADGAQWVPGFWTSADVNQLAYLPPPPEARNEGVDAATPPAASFFWAPGYWAYGNSGYEWSPGYWANAVMGWVWTPPHYAWTPGGVVFIQGYWDHPLDDRGMLFAPVYFETPLYQQAGFAYTPRALVDLSALADNLFVNPAWQEYYFGDYYGGQYAQSGIYPWFAVGTAGYRYDPIFAYRNWFYGRQNPHWRQDYRQRYDRLVKNPAERPPHTWHDQRMLAARGAANRERIRPRMASSFQETVKEGHRGNPVIRLNDNQRREARQFAETHRSVARDRSAFERVAPRANPGPAVRPAPNVRTPPNVRNTERPTGRTLALPRMRAEVRSAPVNRAQPRAEPRMNARPQPARAAARGPIPHGPPVARPREPQKR